MPSPIKSPPLDDITSIEPLHVLEERFFDLSIDMLCVLGFNGYFKRLNASWERTLGFTIKELTSRPFIEFVHPDDRARTLNQNGKVRGGGQALSFENRYLCKDGSFRWLRWSGNFKCLPLFCFDLLLFHFSPLIRFLNLLICPLNGRRLLSGVCSRFLWITTVKPLLICFGYFFARNL